MQKTLESIRPAVVDTAKETGENFLGFWKSVGKAGSFAVRFTCSGAALICLTLGGLGVWLAQRPFSNPLPVKIKQ